MACSFLNRSFLVTHIEIIRRRIDIAKLNYSSAWRVDEVLEPGGEFWRVVLSPALVDEADFEQIAEMGAVFVAKGSELDLHEGAEIQDAGRLDR